MAKKSTRKSRKSSRPRSDRSDSSVSDSRRGMDFNPDYSYVVKDLQRILLYAGSCIAILVILNFIL